jgi:hypothetical protein
MIFVTDTDLNEMVEVEGKYIRTNWVNCEIPLGDGKRTFVSGPRMASTLRQCHKQPQFWFKPFGDNPKHGGAECDGWITVTPIGWIAQYSTPFLSYASNAFRMSHELKQDSNENVMLRVVAHLGGFLSAFRTEYGLSGYDTGNISGFSTLALLFIVRPPRLWLAGSTVLQSLAINVDDNWQTIAKNEILTKAEL